MKLILPLLLILTPLFAHSDVPKLSEESVRIDHSSAEVRYHSRTDGIWWTLEDDGKLLLHLNLKKIKKSDFPIERIDLDQLYAGQSIAMNDSELTDYFEGDFKPKYPNLEKHVFEAVKAGTAEKPYYQLLGGPQ